jgi:hypothetical protein
MLKGKPPATLKATSMAMGGEWFEQSRRCSMVDAERQRVTGVACAIGGALWVGNVLLGVLNSEGMHGNIATFRSWEAVFVLLQILLLSGVVGLARSGATGAGWLGRIGLGIALVGRTAFVLAELHNFAKGADDSPLLPLGALVTGLGMVLVGLAVLRARRWAGWHRPIPLLAGLYPFGAMFPILAATGQPPEPLIALWGALWFLLGLALHAEAGVPMSASLQSLPTR